MKIIVAALIFMLSIISIESKPHVEVEKQRLIQFPIDDTTKIILKQQSENTKRIYEEIAKINDALGYTKRAFPSKVSTMSSQEGYFYPRATEQLHLPVFLRTPNNQGSSSRYMAKQIFGFIPSPFNQQTFYYPAPYLQLPSRDQPRLFRSEDIEDEDEDEDDDEDDDDDEDASDDDNTYIYHTLPTSITDPNYYRKDKMTKFKKSKNIKDENTEVEDLLAVIGYDHLSEIEAVMDEDSDEDHTTTTTKQTKLNKDKYISDGTRAEKLSKRGRTSNDREKLEVTQTTPLSISNERPASLKTFGLGGPSKPVTKKPSTSTQKITLNEAQKETLKAPNFGQLFQTPTSQAIRDVMKDGGTVIHRLKVRKGGIAIAGPGGVATAGSGGTAIVGPGGLALTHPRGLSIAGPGARVVSIPEHVDLEEVALKASARSIPIEGKLVATGPVVYYNP